MSKGTITQIIGPVVDVYFENGEANLPKIHDGEDSVRTIAMDSTDGLMRGMEVNLLGKPISIPIGNQIKGRLLNVTGDAIDGIGNLDRSAEYPIHREAGALPERR